MAMTRVDCTIINIDLSLFEKFDLQPILTPGETIIQNF